MKKFNLNNIKADTMYISDEFGHKELDMPTSEQLATIYPDNKQPEGVTEFKHTMVAMLTRFRYEHNLPHKLGLFSVLTKINEKEDKHHRDLFDLSDVPDVDINDHEIVSRINSNKKAVKSGDVVSTEGYFISKEDYDNAFIESCIVEGAFDPAIKIIKIKK